MTVLQQLDMRQCNRCDSCEHDAPPLVFDVSECETYCSYGNNLFVTGEKNIYILSLK